jgi:peptidoglycan/xylan/chitin deacetylase (PgdA/CDA1 family)
MLPAWATKGLRASVRRTGLLSIRYGVSPEKMRKQLHLMIDTLAAADCGPTICVTASNLERHPRISSDLAGLDLSVHGYRHVSYGALTEEEQARDLDRACLSFSAFGFRARGFRGPYLSTNAATSRILRERGFDFDSSHSYIGLPAQASLRAAVLSHARARYEQVESAPQSPYLESELVELPVSLPDDELLIDALGFRNPELILRVFKSMLSDVVNRGSALVLQIHPERFAFCRVALRELLSEATDLGGWKTDLSRLAEWIRNRQNHGQSWPNGHPFVLAVTGDLDALTLGDFGRRLVPGVA